MRGNRNYVYIMNDPSNNLLFGKCIGHGFMNLLAWLIAVWYLSVTDHFRSAFITALYGLLVQIVTFKLYYEDNVSCVFGKSERIPEDLLLLCTLLGGAPAGTLAMLLFNHKTQRITYQKEYMLMSVLSMSVILFVTIFCDQCNFAVYKVINYITFGFLSYVIRN